MNVVITVTVETPPGNIRSCAGSQRASLWLGARLL